MKASAKSVAAAAAQRQEAAKRSFEKSAKGSKPEGLSMSEAAETAGDRPQPSIFQVEAKATFSFRLSKQTHCLIGLTYFLQPFIVKSIQQLPSCFTFNICCIFPLFWHSYELLKSFNLRSYFPSICAVLVCTIFLAFKF